MDFFSNTFNPDEEYNERDIRLWWDIFREGMLTEVRVLEAKNSNFSGYFTSVDKLLNQLEKRPYKGVYAPINEINEACYSRPQRDKFINNTKTTTSDSDIISRRVLMIDLDPKRPSDTNSTDEEKRYARRLALKIYNYLKDAGFSRPIVVDSANGYHLYYKIDMPNDGPKGKSETTISDFLKVIGMLFDNEKVDIDKSVFNASRITKIVGTKSNKGSDTPERPQRFSRFESIPEKWEVTPTSFIERIASSLPIEEKPTRGQTLFNGYDNFNLEDFINAHGIDVVKRSRFNGGEKLILRECPFNCNHKAPDSALFIMDGGGYGFKCLHNSCSQYTFRDFRLHFDPTAYDRKTYGAYQRKAYRYDPKKFEVQPQTEEKGKKWLSMSDIQWQDLSQLAFMPTGFTEIDDKMMGLLPGDISVLTGLTGAGKTSVLDCLALNVIDKGFKVAFWSAEMQDFRFKGWLEQVAAGRGYVKQRAGYTSLWYVPRDVSCKIDKWLDGRLFLYNNDYGNKWLQILEDSKELLQQDVRLFVYDNLMTLDIDELSDNENDRQKQFVNSLKEFAKANNVHCILVAHSKKEYGFLRLESVKGSGDITGIADNAFAIHRVNRDFEIRAKEFYTTYEYNKLLDYSSVLEVLKNRAQGAVGTKAGLFYEPESRRLKNTNDEHINYGWNDTPVQQEITYTPTEIEPDDDEWDGEDLPL